MGTKLGRKNNNPRARVFIDACSSLIGCRYRLGGQMEDTDGALDCLGLVRKYVYLMSGKVLPMEFDGEPVENYHDDFISDPVLLSTRMGEYFNRFLLYEYDTNKTVATDILYLHNGDGSGTFASGINIGNGSVLVATPDLGITPVALSTYIIEAHYKCQQLSL